MKVEDSVGELDQYSYDEVPYPSHPFEATHPDNIYTLAKLFKLDVTVPDNASILELGCASGGNIIPMAVQLPNARIVGIDLSQKQIDDGNRTVDSLGLKNIQLVAGDFNSLDASFGKFDYILCHGVFSWVPPHAQERIFEIFRDFLTPNGIAYVSYNAFPGWFMRGMIRQMMLYHTSGVASRSERPQQARALLSFLVDSTEGQETPFAKFLKSELDMLAKQSDSYLLHEHLEDNNHPMFFYEFVKLLGKFDLQFVSESSLASMVTSNLPPKAAEALTKLTSDLYQRSQYTDFVTNRMFRQSLLTHNDAKPNRHVDPSSIVAGRFSGVFRLNDAAQANNLDNETEVTFVCSNGRQMQTKNLVLKALLYTMMDHSPSTLSQQELYEGIHKRIANLLTIGEREEASIRHLISHNMLEMLVRGDIEMRFLPDRFLRDVPECPKVSKLAMHQAKSGLVTNLRHGILNLDAFTQAIISAFDGTRNREQLISHLEDMVKRGAVNVSVNGQAPGDMRLVYAAAIDRISELLKRNALLVG